MACRYDFGRIRHGMMSGTAVDVSPVRHKALEDVQDRRPLFLSLRSVEIHVPQCSPSWVPPPRTRRRQSAGRRISSASRPRPVAALLLANVDRGHQDDPDAGTRDELDYLAWLLDKCCVKGDRTDGIVRRLAGPRRAHRTQHRSTSAPAQCFLSSGHHAAWIQPAWRDIWSYSHRQLRDMGGE